MSNVLDAADRVAWWLREHLAVLVVVVVAFLALAFFALRSGGGNGGIPAGSVARVGSATITAAELAHWQDVYTKSAKAAGGTAPAAAQARTAAFGVLVGALWVTQEAKAEGVKVSDEQVTASIDGYFQQTGATGPAARAAIQGQLGTTPEDMRFQQRVALLASALQKKATDKVPVPSAAEIQKVYAAEPARWATPTQRDVEIVLSPDQATANKAKAALAAGTPFATVQKQYAAGQGNGKLTGLKNGQSGDAIDRAVFSAPVNQVSGPVDVGAGFVVFRVTKSTPLPAQSLAQASKAISASLEATAKSKAGATYVSELRDRWKGKTSCVAAVKVAEFCGAQAS
jgi:parvulin-like peptidyl-prolyl isomerase